MIQSGPFTGQAAMGSLAPVIRTAQGASAVRMIGDLQRAKFSAS
jgi:hypothetical protein